MRTARTLVFLLLAVPVGAVALGVLIAGTVTVSVLAITPLVVPALMAFRAAVGGVAWLDAEFANELLGTSVSPRLTSPGPRGFWRRGLNVLADAAFWRQQAYLFARTTAGFAVAVGEWALLAASLGALTAPIWYRWTDAQVANGWHVSSIGRALLGVPAGLAGLALALLLIRPLAAGSAFLVAGLLGGGGEGGRPPSRDEARRGLELHVGAYVVVNLFLTAVWALTSRGYFWPMWTMIVFAIPLALHAFVELRLERVQRIPRGLALQLAASGALAVFFTLVWAVTSRGYFWPVWPILALGVVALVHGGVVFAQRGSQERIAVLEESRAGAVDQQETELERIERDLHDGAQARLVALGMSLGMAEQKLSSDPDAAKELLAEARQGTREALEELRSLARGIHPPVLADRGLEAAVSALADRTPVRVDVRVDVPRRPSRAVENAAYFVVAEALANAGKHADANRVAIDVREDDGNLVVEIVDDGAGGANPKGGGLLGLARRVQALDGDLEVISPSGGPTTVRAVIPCGS
jgi:signal transduction histidine kinase